MSYYPGGPAPNQSSYPGGPQSSYPGGPQSSYPGDPLASSSSSSGGYHQSSYPGGPQSSYPGAPPSSYNSAPGYDSHASSNYNSPSPYGAPATANQAPYNNASYPQQQHQQQGPTQYDEHGNPVDGERGIGTMAAGAAAGWAGNKMTGGHMGTFGSMASGAILAQVGKMVYEKFDDKKHHNGGGGYGGNPYGPPPGGHHGGGAGGLGGFFKH
ncbi:uncharacterized protein SRS1_13822 [Sporisorium reilianum f. sp. reilianum]|uniref:Glycine zipper 2TM domain-containing protein n=1 Tax=Sporisorium reilianum f. sp. reilianum TaxID=72559 RepID=A0A2N8UE12_9BASI|nr:uncharacterized protein SRS1_13822 [Sporisorium reilianum f. sp. reilianum]